MNLADLLSSIPTDKDGNILLDPAKLAALQELTQSNEPKGSCTQSNEPSFSLTLSEPGPSNLVLTMSEPGVPTLYETKESHSLPIPTPVDNLTIPMEFLPEKEEIQDHKLTLDASDAGYMGIGELIMKYASGSAYISVVETAMTESRRFITDGNPAVSMGNLQAAYESAADFRNELKEIIPEEEWSDYFIIPDLWYISKTKPYAHQLGAFLKFRDEPFGALFMEMGTGKTKTALDILAYKYLKYDTQGVTSLLLIAPNMVHRQWAEKEIPLHFPFPKEVYIWKGDQLPKKEKKELNLFITPPYTEEEEEDNPPIRMFCINVEAFQGESILPYVEGFCGTSFPLIVLDESSKIKAEKSRRSRFIRKLNTTGHRLILTGTPATKTPLNLYSQFDFLQEYFWGENMTAGIFEMRHSYTVRSKRHRRRMTYQQQQEIRDTFDQVVELQKNKKKGNKGLKEEDQRTPYEITAKILGCSVHDVELLCQTEEYQEVKGLPAILQAIEPHSFKVKKRDCLDLPSKIYFDMVVEMSPKHLNYYRQMVETMKVTIEESGEELTANGTLAWMIRLMQITGGILPQYIGEDENGKPMFQQNRIYDNALDNPKIKALIEDLEDNLEEPGKEKGSKAIIYCNFDLEIEYIREAMEKSGYGYTMYHGKMTADEKSQSMRIFQEEDQCQIFIAKTDVASHGLNFQFCSLTYYYSNTFRVESRIQSEDRTHRNGQTESCNYKDLIFQNSFDGYVRDNLRKGLDLNSVVTSENIADAAFYEV